MWVALNCFPILLMFAGTQTAVAGFCHREKSHGIIITILRLLRSTPLLHGGRSGAFSQLPSLAASNQ